MIKSCIQKISFRNISRYERIARPVRKVRKAKILGIDDKIIEQADNSELIRSHKMGFLRKQVISFGKSSFLMFDWALNLPIRVCDNKPITLKLFCHSYYTFLFVYKNK